MRTTMRVGVLAAATIAAGCAQGTDGDVELASGIYELATTAVEGDCAIDDAITPGAEYAGKVARVDTDVSEQRVKLQPCDDFFEDECLPAAFSEPLSMLREGQELYARDDRWQVPGCLCLDDWRGIREVTGLIVEDGRAELTWSFELPPAPEVCTCSAAACSSTVTQQLALP